jgi:SpoVK/Ycf46/Vps4 family AAA+-type ATPase
MQHQMSRLSMIWSVRALLRPKAFQRFARHNAPDEDVLQAIGLEKLIDKAISKIELRRELKARLQKLETSHFSRKGAFFRNVDRLGKMINLSECEKEILLFSFSLEMGDALKESVETLGNVNHKQFIAELSTILGYQKSLIQKALMHDSPLISSGLLELNKEMSSEISEHFEILHGLAGAMESGNIEGSLSSYFHMAKNPKLDLQDYGHIQKDLGILCSFLQKCLKKRVSGVNVLIYGVPGTGKTELAKAVAQDLKVKLYEVSSVDEDGDPADGDHRFRSYLLCQRLFSRRSDVLILFDEAEDVFPVDDFIFFGKVRRTGKNKGWTNRILESNPIPAIWISNGVQQIDPAFLRRFDLVLELSIPPRSVRKRMLERGLAGIMVGEDWLEKMAHNENLAPAHIEKAVKVAKLVKSSNNEEVLQQVIANTHKAMGFSQKAAVHRCEYDIQLVNVDFDLQALIGGLRQRGTGRICLYGPPGSGKTAYVHHLGEKVNKPVLLKRASDILGSYVGQTERRIASMFGEAKDEGSILLLDEADSFLQSRGRANHSWEVTQVNELLVQMEAFDGMFFCATNLMDLLDSAVFRRFDVKAKFGYLRPDQVMSMFGSFLLGAGVKSIDEKAWKSRLSDLRELTPGDFAAVRRRLNLTGQIVTPEVLHAELQKEISIRPNHARQVGFQHHR